MANAIRVLAMDAVQRAGSGHPGMPMGMADIAVALWHEHFRHNPSNPEWANRDRFVVSNGHGSMLLYALLHLTGYDLPMAELKRFRQLHSKTPGHPEYGYTPGVETTTGPLGQGLANAVGMALAEVMLAAEFNREGLPLVDHHTYVFLGDGCLMEGISHEACSLAGTWQLNKLIAFYDDNGISIDGDVDGWFTDDTPARFRAYGWNVIPDVDGHDITAVSQAIAQARLSADRPTLICCRTVIACGAPTKAGGHDAHGTPLGETEIAAAREQLGWTAAPFVIPEPIASQWDHRKQGEEDEAEWRGLFARYAKVHPTLAAEFTRRMKGELPDDFDTKAAAFIAATAARAPRVASRKASQDCIEELSSWLPELVGGSADLAPSNLTKWKDAQAFGRERRGRYLHYGVREFGMAAIMNGLCLHGGVRPFGGTFLMFSEYARNALRMGALMKINPIYVFTHDSIGLGEDGPTHQPVEQTSTLRAIPNMDVWRPCDAVETAVAWISAVRNRATPACLVLSRQNLAVPSRTHEQVDAIFRGGYVLLPEAGQLAAVLIATGSEVQLAMDAAARLMAHGLHVRVVSMPSCYQFDRQPDRWKEAVLPPGIPRIAIEAGSEDFWRKYVGLEGDVIGMTTFGESAPASDLFVHFGLTADAVVERVERICHQIGTHRL
ncbi:transketolase [Burkholderia sp. R-69980]|nr:transketolase [Burkholderia sp. ST111]MBK5124353.1 transketolase [Burkholderia sp. R-69980]